MIRFLNFNKELTKHMATPLNDITKLLKSIGEKVADLISQQKRVEQQLATVTLEVDLPGLKNSPTMDKIKPSSIKLASRKELRKNYGILRDLFDTLTTLDATEAKLQTNLTKAKDINPAKVQVELTRLKNQVKAGINSALNFLEGLTEKTHPVALTKLVGVVQSALSKNLSYESISLRSFVFEADEALCYTDYIRIAGLIDESGKYRSELYVVVTCKTGTDAEFYLSVLSTFEPPSEDLLTKRVKTAKEVLLGLALLLNLEKIDNAINMLPISVVMAPSSITKDLFSYEAYIAKIIADEDQVQFVLKPTVREKSLVDQISGKIFKEFNALLRKTNARLRMSVSKSKTQFTLKFFFMSSNDSPLVGQEDLSFLADRFNLSDAAIEKIVKVINVGS